MSQYFSLTRDDKRNKLFRKTVEKRNCADVNTAQSEEKAVVLRSFLQQTISYFVILQSKDSLQTSLCSCTLAKPLLFAKHLLRVQVLMPWLTGSKRGSGEFAKTICVGVLKINS